MLKKIILIILSASILIGAVCAAPSASAEEVAETGATEFGIDRKYLIAGEPIAVNNPQGSELRFYVADEEVARDSFTPSADHYEKWITVKAYSGEKVVDEDSVYFSKLPVLYINTDDGKAITSKDDYKTGDIYIQSNTAVSDVIYDGSMNIKGRGNSTWRWQKKPYRIKLDKKTDLFGMGKNKNWVLLANYLDECMMRSDTGFRISEELGLTTMSSVWTDVVLNGKYVGNYQLCEQIRIDDDRVDVFDWEDEAESVASAVSKAEKKKGNNLDKGELEDHLKENLSWITEGSFEFGGSVYVVEDYYDPEDDISGGYLFEMSDEYDELSKFLTEAGLKVMIKSPEYLSTNTEMMDYVMKYLQWFENAYRSEDGYTDTDDGRVHYSKLADIDSMVEYWLVMEIMGNEDAIKKSRYAYKDIGGLLTFGPVWDFDWGCASIVVGTSAENWKITLGNNKQNFYKDFADDPLFIAKATEKYWQIRPFLESLIAEGGILDNNVEYLLESGLADHEVWDRSERWGEEARGFIKDADDFITYLRKRIVWLDEQFETDDALLKSTYTKLSAAPYVRGVDDLAITLTNAAPDTADHAPADGVVEADSDVAVNMNVKKSGTTSVSVYVNGLFYRSIPCGVGAVPFKVDGGLLYGEENKKNVISFIGKNSSGNTTCRNFVTVIRTGSAAEYILGDTDGNGDIETVDATFVQRSIANVETPFTQAQLMRGDADQNGTLEIIDVTAIQYFLCQFKIDLPIGQLVT